MSRVLRAYGPALVWATVVFVIGGQSDIGPSIDLPMIDKAAHFFMYGGLGALAAWGWLRAGRWPARFWPLLLVAVIGGCDEVRQSIVPGRSPDVADWVADVTGALLGFVLVTSRGSRTRQRGSHEP